jgi:hypothetical protein
LAQLVGAANLTASGQTDRVKLPDFIKIDIEGRPRQRWGSSLDEE